MSAFPFTGHGRSGDRFSFLAILTLTVASALTGAVVAIIAQRVLSRHQVIEVLPQPARVHHLQQQSTMPAASAGAATAAGQVATSTVNSDATDTQSPLGAVGTKISANRLAELEGLLTEDDVIAGDGTDTCPAEFPIKANGRSGIYHWPGAFAYSQTRPTLCFTTTEAADRAGFRPARR